MMHDIESLYLIGASTKMELTNFIDNMCTKEEQANKKNIMMEWTGAFRYFQEEIVEKNQNEEQNIIIKDIPKEYHSLIDTYANDPLIQREFFTCPYSFKMVELDHLILPQRSVKLNYVSKMSRQYSIPELVNLCISPKKNGLPLPIERNLSQNTRAYISDDLNLRFLGAIPMAIDPKNIEKYDIGGVPQTAIMLMVGHGTSTINAVSVNGRIILVNGTNRIYALRKAGVEYAPILIRHISRPYLELPQFLGDFPIEHLTKGPRPAMLKDFFNSKLTRICCVA